MSTQWLNYETKALARGLNNKGSIAYQVLADFLADQFHFDDIELLRIRNYLLFTRIANTIFNFGNGFGDGNGDGNGDGFGNGGGFGDGDGNGFGDGNGDGGGFGDGDGDGDGGGFGDGDY